MNVFKNEFVKISKAFSSLASAQIFLLVIPFITYPILIRVYGAEDYGQFVFLLSLLSIAQVFINYGFELSATKSVAESLDSISRSKILLEVTFFKVIVSTLLFIISVFYFAVGDGDRSEIYLFYSCFLLVVIESLYPNWFFIGVEKQAFIPLVIVPSKIIYFLFVLFLVNEKMSLWVVVAIQSLCSAFSLLFFYYFIKLKFDFKLVSISVLDLKARVMGGFIFFVSRVSGILNVKLGVSLVGMYCNPAQVAYYDLAQKLIDIVRMPIHIINQVIYPRVIKTKKASLALFMILILLVYSLIIFAIIVFYGKSIISNFAGNEMLDSYPVLLALIWLVPLSSINWILGDSVLVALGNKRLFLISVIVSTLFFIFYCSYLAYFNLVTMHNISTGVVITSVVLLILRLFFAIKNKLIF